MRMKFLSTVSCLTWGPLALFLAIEPLQAQSPKPVTDGLSLAKQLRAQTPSENQQLSATLEIRDKDLFGPNINLQITTELGNEFWQTIYQTLPNGNQSAERLRILHLLDQAPRYVLETLPTATTPTGSSKDAVTPESDPGPLIRFGELAVQSFAGSDFWLADLGLEFLYWPNQTLVKTQTRRGRQCWVLESQNPSPTSNNYAKVLSWIDQKTLALVRADAYDRQGRILKEFQPDEFTKIDGKWYVKELYIKNKVTGSTTALIFHY